MGGITRGTKASQAGLRLLTVVSARKDAAAAPQESSGGARRDDAGRGGLIRVLAESGQVDGWPGESRSILRAHHSAAGARRGSPALSASFSRSPGTWFWLAIERAVECGDAVEAHPPVGRDGGGDRGHLPSHGSDGDCSPFREVDWPVFTRNE